MWVAETNLEDFIRMVKNHRAAIVLWCVRRGCVIEEEEGYMWELGAIIPSMMTDDIAAIYTIGCKKTYAEAVSAAKETIEELKNYAKEVIYGRLVI